MLYSDVRPYYVGITRSERLGDRRKDHLSAWHAGWWQRFSWFGFKRALLSANFFYDVVRKRTAYDR